MRRHTLNFDPDMRVVVRGHVVESENARHLSEDMAEVELPNGILVTVGWFQRDGLTGEYVIAPLLGTETISEPFRTSAPLQAIEAVIDFVNQFADQGDTIARSLADDAPFPELYELCA